MAYPRYTSLARALGLLLAGLVAAQACISGAKAREICRFAGTTDDAGHVGVTTDVAATNGMTRVDVRLTFEATRLWLLHIHYLVDEVSTWRAGEMESVAVNTRYLVGDHIIRQQWDSFQRGRDGLQAQRVQGKTLADFQRQHPGFVQHWDPATFGLPWLQDYPSASPERRADLDLKTAPFPADLRPPLAMAFYWVRWLPRGGEDVPVFLPGFKADKLVKVPITDAPVADGPQWRAPVRYPGLKAKRGSVAAAWTSSDRHLLQLAFEVHASQGSARGQIDQEGCTGAPVVPSESRRRP